MEIELNSNELAISYAGSMVKLDTGPDANTGLNDGLTQGAEFLGKRLEAGKRTNIREIHRIFRQHHLRSHTVLAKLRFDRPKWFTDDVPKPHCSPSWIAHKSHGCPAKAKLIGTAPTELGGLASHIPDHRLCSLCAEPELTTSLDILVIQSIHSAFKRSNEFAFYHAFRSIFADKLALPQGHFRVSTAS